ncbi:MAG: hypothetical protein K0Q79_2690 [Flavipsychrobacter sp.]|jgi:uncharacterized membrane protein YkvA (DUF1232 family)|nr:hypothetical protein [Flavipsychrobacter sp.]
MARFTPVRSVQNIRHGWHLFKNRRTMWQMVREIVKGQYKMSLPTLAIIVISLIYIISPIDIAPDFIPVLGWLDDGLVLYFLLKRFTSETQRFTRHKAAERRSHC